jgi:hypothetical protein
LSGRFHLHFLFRAILLALFGVGFLLTPAALRAADPPRPYIELPFPRDTRYEVTCGYSCYQHRGSMTYAVDFRVPEGDPIVAAAAGEVMAVTWEVGLPANLDLGDALILYIDHGNGWFTRYVHLQGITVEVGDQVDMGDVIGYSGKTGTQGAHLHFELKYGTSLHSPSVPINELFDGNPPVDEQAYLSNNRTLTKLPPTPVAEEGRGITLPTATATPEMVTIPSLPWVTQPLLLSTEAITQGETFEATFTLKNNTTTRLNLAMLGVAGRDVGSTSLRSDLLFFDRAVILNPGREYQFKRTMTLDELGPAELFVFALGTDNEWIPLGGDTTAVAIDVARPALTHHVYLPALMSDAPTTPLEISEPDPTETPPPSPTASSSEADLPVRNR